MTRISDRKALQRLARGETQSDVARTYNGGANVVASNETPRPVTRAR
jgi:hypothetical protein